MDYAWRTLNRYIDISVFGSYNFPRRRLIRKCWQLDKRMYLPIYTLFLLSYTQYQYMLLDP